ncbi:hypothetical protein NT6N_37310 [Oceaniferula spumae]|uniref:histidine kinase n=1 Tax=Oceaniferula spumae TaxID=2979115 RepID=A0AAT9FRS0_9BACT
MTALEADRYPYSRGGLFRRLIFPLVILTLITVFFSLYNARQVEKEHHRNRLKSIGSSNAQLFQRISLPRTGRLAKDLSTTTGVTILFSHSRSGLTSSIPLNESQQKLAFETLETPGQALEDDGYQAVAFTISDSPQEAIIALESIPRWSLFETSNLTPTLLSSLVFALGAAFIISRSAVNPLEKLVKAIRNTPGDEALTLPSSLLEQRDEIGILTRELVSSRQRLIDEQQKRERAERLAMLGQLTTSLAHEIKNPAASIIMHGQALEQQHDNPIGSLIQEEGEQIVSLVDQWLFVAKPEGTQHSSNDLVAILEQLLKKLQPLFDFHAVSVITNFPDELFFQCDAHRIELVFRNLLSNSIHAMPEGGRITVTLTENPTDLTFSVHDQGSGFSDEALSHFGEAFYSEREGGMGLGLTLVKEVVMAHGGDVEARNSDQGGALVTGRIPKHATPTTSLS